MRWGCGRGTYHVKADLGGLSDGGERDAPVDGLVREDELDEAEDGDLLLHSVDVLHEDGLAGQLLLVLRHKLLVLVDIALVEGVEQVVQPLALRAQKRIHDRVRQLDEEEEESGEHSYGRERVNDSRKGSVAYKVAKAVDVLTDQGRDAEVEGHLEPFLLREGLDRGV